jgi:hypothetical protein
MKGRISCLTFFVDFFAEPGSTAAFLEKNHSGHMENFFDSKVTTEGKTSKKMR